MRGPPWREQSRRSGLELPMPHPDLPAEQAYLDRAYRRLELVRSETEARLKEAFGEERGGTFQSYTERDIRVRSSISRLEKLELGREALIFGRIDRDASGDASGDASRDQGEESFHIGRVALSDERHEPLVVDWRAPVAEPFYRATGAHPMGLRRRRHFLTEARRVVDLEDELFASDGKTAEGNGPQVLGLSGPAVLMAVLSRSHTGRMRDIVATVQAEQDEVIRAPLAGAIVVQGGPGTGKTAVALHRAAYLLYTHRWPLEGQGVLVVGPNPTFLHYIDQVLPSLGETGVELTTVSGIYRASRPRADEPPDVARLKGDPRMARLVQRAVRQRERALRERLDVPYGSMTLAITPAASEALVGAARRRPGTHNARRRFVESQLWQHLASQLAERDQARAGNRGPAEAGNGPEMKQLVAGVRAELRGRPEIVLALDRMWPRLSAEELLHDLFGAKALLAGAGRGVFGEAELGLLRRRRSASVKQVDWSAADMALLDEASALLGPRSIRPLTSTARSLAAGSADAGADGALRTYGHIVVDEAQDLSPMELRMVGRRSLSGSMTLAGDIAQATGPRAPASWEDVMAHLPVNHGWRQVALSVSYRAPAEVMGLAAAVLREALPGAIPPDPVRRTDEHPRFVEISSEVSGDVAGDASDAGELWYPALPNTVREELAAVASSDGTEDGNVGVLVPPELLAPARSALEAGGVSFGEVGSGALDSRVSLLVLADAKGLEFDSVIVVEPALIAARGPHGMRALYVAITRCTRRLAVVHSRPLPAPLSL